MTANELLGKLSKVKKTGKDQWMARCPAHKDRTPSLSITESDGKILLHCHAGCATDAILAALGINARDLFLDDGKNKTRKKEIVATYDYTDRDGNLVFQVVRYAPKGFAQRRPDGAGDWIWNTKGIKRKPLFNIREVECTLSENGAVWIVGGEKDVQSAEKIGLAATCNPGGEGKWKQHHSDTLRGGTVIVLPDRDQPGYDHANKVASSLKGITDSVKIVDPDHAGKDLTDYIKLRTSEGATPKTIKKELESLAAGAAECEPKSKPNTDAETATNESGGDTDTLRARLFVAGQKNQSATAYKRECAQIVVEWLWECGSFYHHRRHEDFAGVLYFDNKRKILQPVQGDAFQAHLSEQMGVNRTEPLFKFAVAQVETEGLSNRATAIEPELYWAARDGAIYLSNGAGQVAKITAQGVQIVDNGKDEILFAAGATLEPWKLTEPKDPFTACRVFNDMQAATAHGKLLSQLWTMALPTNPHCKPPLCFASDVGGGKTTIVRAMFALLGIREAITKVQDKGESDFWTLADAGGLGCLDNADSKIDWLPDSLAAAATGGQNVKRRLYTDGEVVVQESKAWLAVTSANPQFASDAGLSDRLLVARLNRREGETAESELFAEVRAVRDAGLSFIAQSLSKVLADTKPTPGGINARHPDFAKTAVKLGRAIGRESEAVAAMRAAELDKSLFNIQNHWIGSVLLETIQKSSFTGSAKELLEVLKETDPGLDGKLSSKRLSKQLDRLWPHLEVTVGADRWRDSHTKNWVFNLEIAK